MKKAMQYLYITLVLGLMGWVIFGKSDQKETTQNITSDTIFSKNINRSDVSSGTIRLKIPAAEVNLKSNSNSVFDGKVNYSSQFPAPILSENFQNGHLDVELSHEYETATYLRDRNSNYSSIWNIQTRPDISLDYIISVGAGAIDIDLSGSQVNSVSLSTGAAKANLDLSNSLVSDLKIETGVGAVTLDISGSRHNDLKANIKGGIGALTVIVPENYGIRFSASGLGSVTANGFSRENNFYQNEKWGSSQYSIEFRVSAGIGSVNVVTK